MTPKFERIWHFTKLEEPRLSGKIVLKHIGKPSVMPELPITHH